MRGRQTVLKLMLRTHRRKKVSPLSVCFTMCFTYVRVHKRHFETPLSLFRVFESGSRASYAVLRGAQTLRRHVSRIKMSRLKISLKNDRCYVRRTIFGHPYRTSWSSRGRPSSFDALQEALSLTHDRCAGVCLEAHFYILTC